MFMRWPENLPALIEVCPVLLPGRWTRMKEPPFTEITALVWALGESLTPHLDKPFALFGHSTGALIAFELARWLRKHSAREPVHLFSSGCEAPHLVRRSQLFHALADEEFLQEVRRFQGISEDVLAEPELLELILPILRADFQLTSTYVYKDDRPLTCPVTAFAGADDQVVTRAEVEGWREHTAGKFTLRIFHGDHMFLKTERGALLEAIAGKLLSDSAFSLR